MTLYRGGRVVELTRDEIDRRLIATWAALQGAQAAYRHSPNSTTERQLASVRAAMDRHLDLIEDELADAIRGQATIDGADA